MSGEAGEISPLERFAELFTRLGVEFMIVGGQAEVLMGSPRVTYDVDLCYRRTNANLERLATALGTLDLRLRGAPKDLVFVLDARALALGTNYTFEVDGEYALDLLGYLEPIGGFEELLPRSETLLLGQQQVSIIGLDDLITIKRHLGRAKDRESLLQLEAIREMRRPGGSPGSM